MADYNVYENGSAITSSWDEIWDSICASAKDIWSKSVDFFDNQVKPAMDAFGTWLGVKDDWQSLIQNVDGANTDIAAAFQSGITGIQNYLATSADFSTLGSTADTVTGVVGGTITTVLNTAASTAELLNAFDGTLSSLESGISTVVSGADDIIQSFSDALGSISTSLGNNSTTLKTVGKILSVFSDSLADYQDGVTETSFGALQEQSWTGTSSSFVNAVAGKRTSMTVKFLSSTPLDQGSTANLYGTLMLGAPPTFTNISDPCAREYINSFVKDGKFITLTPGLPQYNGLSYSALGGTTTDANGNEVATGGASDSQLNQTTDPDSMISYLLKNGLDDEFASKDKRYYTFKASYEQYFSYLETMLNAVYVKMGLATEDGSTFDLFSFFNLGKSKTSGDYGTFDGKYMNSLGFWVNPAGSLSESIDSSPTSFGSDLAGQVNAQSDTYAKENYITGMGTGGSARNVSRVAANTINTTISLKNLVSDNLNYAKQLSGSVSNAIGKVIAYAVGAVFDAGLYTTQNDMGQQVQMYATTNGMRVTYPELWYSTEYNRSFTVNFEFVSPYGDPMSIFQNVYVPFCALLCFAMPRQAAENGLVSPFLVRGDVSGLTTIDLGMITGFTFTRGGSNEMWTKDGLPLAISGNFSIVDLYPFLSMSKRLSYLSANPNYSVFLNNMAGLHATYSIDDTALSDYFKQMLNRVSGQSNATEKKLWNGYGSASRAAHTAASEAARQTRINLAGSKVPWMRKK